MKEDSSCINCIFQSPATKLLTLDELSRLNENCALTDLKAGEIIFKQGVFSTHIVYLRNGIVKLHLEGPHKDHILKIVKGPAYIGIPTTFDEKYYRYSASAVVHSGACYIDIDTFKNFIYNNGQFAYEIIVELCKDELHQFRQCVSKAQKNVRGRIADALLFFAEEIFTNDFFVLPLNRSEFGNYIDATRESVSRILTEFHNDGIIELKGKNIKLIKKELLEIIGKNG